MKKQKGVEGCYQTSKRTQSES